MVSTVNDYNPKTHSSQTSSHDRTHSDPSAFISTPKFDRPSPRWPLVLQFVPFFDPQSSPSPDRDSAYTLVEKDITTMDLKLETPVDLTPKAGLTPAAPSDQRTKINDIEYFMDMVVFDVEDNLFRVPTHYFRTSTDFFTPFFDFLAAKGEDEKILRLEEVTKAEFRGLLKFMYPLPLTLTRNLSDEDWVSVLKLSTKWMMLDVRRTAIEHLTASKMSPADRVVLARSYSVFEWLRSAYVALADTVECISPQDMAKVGLESTFKLHHAREQVLATVSTTRSPHDHLQAVQTAFGNEFEDMQEAGRDAVERVSLAQKYNVVEWLHAAFIELVERPQTLSVDDARKLGYETAIRLCSVRELRLSQDACQPQAQSSAALIDKELETELRELSSRSVLDRAVLAREYRVAEWIRSALVELTEREEMLSVDEASRLGFETAIELCRIRQGPFQSVARGMFVSHYEIAIGREFEAELRDLRVAGDLYRRPEKVEVVDTLAEIEGLVTREEPEKEGPKKLLNRSSPKQGKGARGPGARGGVRQPNQTGSKCGGA